MCRPATCRTCGKSTWAARGQHVDQVMASVPTAQRCPGHVGPEDTSTSGLFLRRLFGRR